MQLTQRLLSTRAGTIALAGSAAILAGIVVLVYINRYRTSVNQSAEPVSVLVAKNLIEKGTPGNVIGTDGLYQTARVAKGDLKDGAILDPSSLRGRVAVEDIYPGKQLTAADFTATTSDALDLKLARDQRAVSVPLDGAHGLVGHVQSGDHIDVLVGFNVQKLLPDGTPDPNAATRPVLRMIMQNVLVLAAPSDAKSGLAGGGETNIVLRVDPEQAAQLAFASDNGKVWIVLRPKNGAPPVSPSFVTLETALLGVKPVVALKSLGGRP